MFLLIISPVSAAAGLDCAKQLMATIQTVMKIEAIAEYPSRDKILNVGIAITRPNIPAESAATQTVAHIGLSTNVLNAIESVRIPAEKKTRIK